MRCAALCLWIVCLVAPAFAADDDVLQTEMTSGPVSARVTLSPKAPRIGDTLVVTLTVIAQPGVELLLPEFGEALDQFPVRDFVPSNKLDAQGRTVASQTYRLDTPRSGALRIPPLLIEFVDRRPGKTHAPAGLDAYEMLTEGISFEVTSVLPTDAAADLAAPLGILEHVEPPTSTQWLIWVWLAGIAALTLAFFFGSRLWGRWRRLARRQSAYAIARARMDKLLSQSLPTDRSGIDAFFVNLSRVVRRYLENRYELRAPELTTEEFLDTVSVSPDLTSEHRTLLRDFLRRADLVKFAHFEPTDAQMQESIKLAEQFLEETRENAPLLDVETSTAEALHG